MCKKNKDHSIARFVVEMEFIYSDLDVNDILKHLFKNIILPVIIVKLIPAERLMFVRRKGIISMVKLKRFPIS